VGSSARATRGIAATIDHPIAPRRGAE
jgi:hypothetical protein